MSDYKFEEREAARCPYFREKGEHDWRVNPNQVISGGESVEIKVLCPHCRTDKVMHAKRSYHNINPSDPMTWRPYRLGVKPRI